MTTKSYDHLVMIAEMTSNAALRHVLFPVCCGLSRRQAPAVLICVDLIREDVVQPIGAEIERIQYNRRRT